MGEEARLPDGVPPTLSHAQVHSDALGGWDWGRAGWGLWDDVGQGGGGVSWKVEAALNRTQESKLSASPCSHAPNPILFLGLGENPGVLVLVSMTMPCCPTHSHPQVS